MVVAARKVQRLSALLRGLQAALLLACLVFLFTSVIVEAQDVADPIGIGRRAETLGIIGIEAAVIVLLAGALVWVYRGKEQQAAESNRILRELVGTTTMAVEGARNVMVEVRETIAECGRRRGP